MDSQEIARRLRRAEAAIEEAQKLVKGQEEPDQRALRELAEAWDQVHRARRQVESG